LHPAAPTFTEMDMALTTRDRGKPAGTRLELSIVPDDADTPAAYLDVQDRAFSPTSTLQVVTPAAGASFVLKSLKHQVIRVKITGAGYGSWTFSFDVVLHFTNGAEALFSSGSKALSEANPQMDLPLSEATVASASTVGRMERYMFSLLSKGGGPKQGPSAAISQTGSESGSASYLKNKASSNPREFVEMEVSLNTRSRAKPAGTGLEFYIVPKSGDPKVAYLDLTGTELLPDSKTVVVVPESGTGFTLDQLKKEQVGVRISPAGMITWSCNFDVTLRFANGTQVLLGSGDQTLGPGRPEALIPLSDAMVASPTMIGGLEKFGFRLMK
jgi:hypothetical protein